MSSRHVCSLFDRTCWSSAHLPVHVPVIKIMAMNREKGGRHNQFLDKWLKQFGWLQTRGSGDDLLMIYNDCTKTGKKNAFTSVCKNFQRSALVRHMSQADHKSSAKVLLWQKHFKAASDNASNSLRASSRARGLGFCWGEEVGGGKRMRACSGVSRI